MTGLLCDPCLSAGRPEGLARCPLAGTQPARDPSSCLAITNFYENKKGQPFSD